MQAYRRFFLTNYLPKVTRAECGVINTAALWHNLNKYLCLVTTLIYSFLPVTQNHVSYYLLTRLLCVFVRRSKFNYSTLVYAVMLAVYTDIRHLTTGIRSEKCVVRRFRRCAKVYLHQPRQYTPRVYGMAYCS